MANCSAGEFSELPRIADFFHSFPHENFYFDNVSSTFIPTLPDYQQVSELYFFFWNNLSCAATNACFIKFTACFPFGIKLSLLCLLGSKVVNEVSRDINEFL